jgi:hypothetical protein
MRKKNTSIKIRKMKIRGISMNFGKIAQYQNMAHCYVLNCEPIPPTHP